MSGEAGEASFWGDSQGLITNSAGIRAVSAGVVGLIAMERGRYVKPRDRVDVEHGF